MDSFDIISYSSVTKCRVQCHSSKWYNFYYSFLFSLKNVFFLQPQSAKTPIKNRGLRSLFMAKIQQTAQFRLQMIILRKGTGTIFKIGTFLAGRIINQLEYTEKRPLLPWPLFRRLVKTIFYLPTTFYVNKSRQFFYYLFIHLFINFLKTIRFFVFI